MLRSLIKSIFFLNTPFYFILQSNYLAASTTTDQQPDELSSKETSSDWEISGLPAFIRSPETGLGLGGVMVVVPPATGKRENPITTGIMYTEKKQFLFGAGSRQYFNEDKTSVSFGLNIEDYPDFEFGVGNQADRHSGRLYKKDLFNFYIDYLESYQPNLYMGLALDYHYREFSNFEEGGRLDQNLLHGQGGGSTTGLLGVLRHDNGNDPFLPTYGDFLFVTYGRYFSSKSDYEYNKFNFDLRLYRPIEVGEQASTAFQFVIFDLSENPPWDLLPTLGGNQLLRGFFKGRYRDRKLAASQFEWRQRIYPKWWLVGFYGVGQVARDWDQIRPSEFHQGSGIGGRYQIGERTRMNLRLDLAWASDADNPSLYVYVMEAF